MRARILSQTNAGAIGGGPAEETQTYTFGMRFTVSTATNAHAIWFQWGLPDSNQGDARTGLSAVIYRQDTGAQVAGTLKTGLAITTGWNRFQFTSPVALSTGITYIVAVFTPSGRWWAQNANVHSSGRTRGYLSTPANAGCFSAAGVLTMPTNSQVTNYGVDVEIESPFVEPGLSGVDGSWDFTYANYAAAQAAGWTTTNPDTGETATGAITWSAGGAEVPITSTAATPTVDAIFRALPDGWRRVEMSVQFTPLNTDNAAVQLGLYDANAAAASWQSVGFEWTGCPLYSDRAPWDPGTTGYLRRRASIGAKKGSLTTGQITEPRWLRIDRDDDGNLAFMFSEDGAGRAWIPISVTQQNANPTHLAIWGRGTTSALPFTVLSVAVGMDPVPLPVASGNFFVGDQPANAMIGGDQVLAGYYGEEWVYQPTLTGDYVAFHFTGANAQPWVEKHPGSTAQCLWTLADNKVISVADAPYLDFGIYSEQELRLFVRDDGVDAFDQVAMVNLGFDNSEDAGDFQIGAAYDWLPQPITEIENFQLLTGLKWFMAAHSILETIDFTDMADLEHIELFYAETNAVALTGCDSLKRLCIESCRVPYLDLNPVSATLRDLRYAIQRDVGGTVELAPISGTMTLEYHYCVRDQVVVNQIPFAKQPMLRERWDWNTGQTTTDYANIPVSTTSMVTYGQDWTEAAVNGILQRLDANGATGGTIQIDDGIAANGSPAAPTGAGVTAKNNLIVKGWTVLTN